MSPIPAFFFAKWQCEFLMFGPVFRTTLLREKGNYPIQTRKNFFACILLGIFT